MLDGVFGLGSLCFRPPTLSLRDIPLFGLSIAESFSSLICNLFDAREEGVRPIIGLFEWLINIILMEIRSDGDLFIPWCNETFVGETNELSHHSYFTPVCERI